MVTYGMDKHNNDKKRKNIENNENNEIEEIYDAASNGNLEFFQKNSDIDLNQKIIFNQTAFHVVCWKDQTAIIEFIVKKNPECINEKDDLKYTALQIACMRNNIDIIKFLLPHGADFNMVDQDGKKPLMVCDKETQIEICHYMRTLRSNNSFLVSELCKYNKTFSQKALTLMMSLKRLQKNTNHQAYKIPKPLIIMIFKMAGIKMVTGSIAELLTADNIEQLITKWTTKDKK